MGRASDILTHQNVDSLCMYNSKVLIEICLEALTLLLLPLPSSPSSMWSQNVL